MSDFLTNLEAQLVGAHPRRRAARRRKAAGRALREAPVALLVAAVLGAAVAFVTQVGSGDPGTAPGTGITSAPAVAAEPTFTAADPPLPADAVVVLNAGARPGLGRGVAEVIGLGRAVAAVGTAPTGARTTVVAYTRGNGSVARRLANGLGVDIRLQVASESVAARKAGVAVLVGSEVLSAGIVPVRPVGAGLTGQAGQITGIDGRLIKVSTTSEGRDAVIVQLEGERPLGQLRPSAETAGRLEATFFGVRQAPRRLLLLQGGTVRGRALLPGYPARAVVRQSVSVLDTVARQPRGGTSLYRVLLRETRPARTAYTPPAIDGVDVQFAAGAGLTAARIARRFGVQARRFRSTLTRAQAGGEAGVAVRLGRSFQRARLVRLDRSTVSVVRYRAARHAASGQTGASKDFEAFCAANPGACDARDSPRCVVVAEVDAPRGSVVTLRAAGRVVREATNTGQGVDEAVTVPECGPGPLEVAVDGRRIGLVPLD